MPQQQKTLQGRAPTSVHGFCRLRIRAAHCVGLDLLRCEGAAVDIGVHIAHPADIPQHLQKERALDLALSAESLAAKRMLQLSSRHAACVSCTAEALFPVRFSKLAQGFALIGGAHQPY